MISPPTFKKVLFQQTFSPQALLECFQKLNHVIFLNNNDNPIIGISPDQYVTCSDQSMQFFEKVEFNQYKKHQQLSQISDFLKSSLDENKPTLTMGFISYDFAANQHIQVKSKTQPSVFFGQFSSYLSYENQTWYFNSYASDAAQIFELVQKQIQTTIPSMTLLLQQACLPRWSKQVYTQAFNQVQNYILAGDCYQINLTQEFTAKAKGTLLSTADQFWQLTNAPYSGYLRFNEFEILSCSPELFIDFNEQREVVTKPIKGTMPRYTDSVLDEQSKQSLQSSEKDKAENVMIVDLLRNDLSLYAEIGTVKTSKLFNIESFNQVHHMVSEVTAILNKEVSPFDVLMAALPGGSITGAPKIRAMQIIEELEGSPRGAYCGSMGYFHSNGTGSWNILIRTLQKYQDELSVWAGGGITISSDCDAEYQECFDKVEALLNLLNKYHLPFE